MQQWADDPETLEVMAYGVVSQIQVNLRHHNDPGAPPNTLPNPLAKTSQRAIQETAKRQEVSFTLWSDRQLCLSHQAGGPGKVFQMRACPKSFSSPACATGILPLRNHTRSLVTEIQPEAR